MIDVLLKGGYIVDGSGQPGVHASLGFSGDTIVFLDKGDEPEAKRIISAEGMVVCPGFCDIHTHADMGVLADPLARNYLMQGVTTVVTGNCGLSMAPCTAKHTGELREYLVPFMPDVENLPWTWSSMADFLAAVERSRPAVNMAPLVGHGALRIAVNGFEPVCDPGKTEAMHSLFAQCMAEGCYGLSTGLIYPPGSYSDAREIESFFPLLRKTGGIYATHLRSEGRHLVEAVAEALGFGELHGVSVQLSHHKCAPSKYWGKTAETLRMIHSARDRGVSVGCDVYPYDGGSTTVTALLPQSALEGGVPAMLKRLRNTETRNQLLRLMENEEVTGDLSPLGIGWERIFVASCPKRPGDEGKHLSDFLGSPPFHSQAERFFDWLLAIHGEALVVTKSMCPADVDMVVSDAFSIIASDSWISDINGPGKPHPRNFGTFSRFLQEYALRRNIIPLERAVSKITAMPARKIGLHHRGLLKEGFKADVVVFDPANVKDLASYETPKQYPEGIRWVFVNGTCVMENTVPNEKRTGRVLRKAGRA